MEDNNLPNSLHHRDYRGKEGKVAVGANVDRRGNSTLEGGLFGVRMRLASTFNFGFYTEEESFPIWLIDILVYRFHTTCY